MPGGKVGRPRRDPERARRVGARIGSRLEQLTLNQTQFAYEIGLTQPSISAFISGKHDAASSPYVGRIAKKLLWTVTELVHGANETDPNATACADGQGHLIIERQLAQALSKIVGEPLSDLSQNAWLRRVDPLCLRKAIAACAEVLPHIRQLKTGRELTGVIRVLEAMIDLANISCDPPFEDASHLVFEATDQLVHCASFVLSAPDLEALTTKHLDRMAAIVVHNGNADPELRQRYLVRRSDVLKILGRNAHAFVMLRGVLDRAEERGSCHTLSYPAFRTSCVLAAKNDTSQREFEKFLKRAHDAIESGHLPPHDVSHVREGIADARATRFQKYQHPLDRKYALQQYEFAIHEAADAARHAGGKHVEFSLRMEMRPLSFADAGIFDLVSVTGMPQQARRQQIAEELREIAIASGNERIARRLA